VYWLRGETPKKSHLALVTLFAMSGGHDNDRLVRAVEIMRPPYRLSSASGVLGNPGTRSASSGWALRVRPARDEGRLSCARLVLRRRLLQLSLFLSRASQIVAVDHESIAPAHARNNCSAANIDYVCACIRSSMPEGEFDNIV
jgi:hypothetical protein